MRYTRLFNKTFSVISGVFAASLMLLTANLFANDLPINKLSADHLIQDKVFAEQLVVDRVFVNTLVVDELLIDDLLTDSFTYQLSVE